MKANSTGPDSREAGSRLMRFSAFSLIEILVAVAVLGVILVMFVQVVSGIVSSTKIQNQQMNAVAAARRALDVITVDLENAVIGENAAILIPIANSANSTTAPIFNLLTARRGEAGAPDHRFLAVSYSLNPSAGLLLRKYGSVSFAATDFLDQAAMAATTDADPLARGILAIQFRAITDETNSYDLQTAPVANWASNSYNSISPNAPAGFNALITTGPLFASELANRTRAIEVWIAAVDEQNYELLDEVGKMPVVQGALGDDPGLWRDQLDGITLPSSMKSGIRILTKTIELP